VEKPDELAAWALQDKQNGHWKKFGMQCRTGRDNSQVNLTKPIPVLILYGTAVAEEHGSIHFFDDLYGHEANFEKVLAKEYSFPK
jgi:murein L,D-transpeptidase YcbB/YkuD